MGELALFLVSPGRTVDDEFKAELKGLIRSALSPRHTPDTIMQMPAVPRNLTGKKLELPVKRILRGAAPDSVVSRQAMADPDSLDAYIDYASDRT
jgi:acetoacetyl-CoA synthetase